MDSSRKDLSSQDNVESPLSEDDTDCEDPMEQEFPFTGAVTLLRRSGKVLCCDFSSDGSLLASAGHDKRLSIWSMEPLNVINSVEEHDLPITDVRFSQSSTRLVTSSFDKTVKIWDAANPNYSLHTFSGHAGGIWSLDVHPLNEDLICSSDEIGGISFWSVHDGRTMSVFQGSVTQTRFQPQHGRLLAAANETAVSIFDVETKARLHYLQGHTKHVQSLCWDASGNYLASITEDSVRVWALGNGSNGECVHELGFYGSKLHSCVFHPNYPSLLILGSCKSLEIWNMAEDKIFTICAHEDMISALAASNATKRVASASRDKTVMLWLSKRFP